MSFTLDLCDVFTWLHWSYAFLAMSQKWWCALFSISGNMWCWYIELWVLLTLTTLLRWCLPGLSTEKLLWEIPGGSIKFHFASNFHPLILISIDNTCLQQLLVLVRCFKDSYMLIWIFTVINSCPHFPIYSSIYLPQYGLWTFILFHGL